MNLNLKLKYQKIFRCPECRKRYMDNNQDRQYVKCPNYTFHQEVMIIKKELDQFSIELKKEDNLYIITLNGKMIGKTEHWGNITAFVDYHSDDYYNEIGCIDITNCNFDDINKQTTLEANQNETKD